MVEPFWYTDDRPRSLGVISGWVEDAAAEVDADYIPGASHWIEGHPEWMAGDGLHPNDEGYAEMARRMDAALTTLGLLATDETRAPSTAYELSRRLDCNVMNSKNEPVDVVLIGGGIMSATLGTLLKQLQPDWTIRVFERWATSPRSPRNPWNNAGTGHAALCELNYTPEERRRLDRHREGHQDQRAVPGLAPVLVVPRRARARCPSPSAVHQPDAAHELRLGRGERRIPAQALRGAEGPAALRRHGVQRDAASSTRGRRC